jgi:hypothetical protein
MKAIAVIKYIFLTFGLIILIGAFFLFADTKDFLKDAQTTHGKVIELIRSRTSDSIVYMPVVEFETKEGSVVEFTSSAGSNPPSYSRGDIVEVLYRESSPEQAKIKSFFSLWGMATVFGIMGGIFFLIGLIIILVGFLKSRKNEYLKQNGIQIKAKFQSVAIDTSLQANGRSPHQIFAQWINPATNELHIFKSENIWFDPTEHIKSDELIVLIESGNPKNYYLDISFLPKIAK